MPEDAALERMCRLPVADVREFEAYVSEVASMAGEMKESVLGFEFFEAAELHSKSADHSVKKAMEWIERGGVAAESTEIRWAVERRCMYWAAVAMIDARIDARVGVVGPGGVTSAAPKATMTETTGPKTTTKMADKMVAAEMASIECSEMLPKVIERPIDRA